MQSNPEHLIIIDETHRDKHAARRRGWWGYKMNLGGVIVKTWFENVAIYTLIAHRLMLC